MTVLAKEIALYMDFRGKNKRKMYDMTPLTEKDNQK